MAQEAVSAREAPERGKRNRRISRPAHRPEVPRPSPPPPAPWQTGRELTEVKRPFLLSWPVLSKKNTRSAFDCHGKLNP